MRLVRDGYFVSLHPSGEFSLLFWRVQSESLNYNPQIKQQRERSHSSAPALLTQPALLSPFFHFALFCHLFLQLSSRSRTLICRWNPKTFQVIRPPFSRTFLLFLIFKISLHHQLCKLLDFHQCLILKTLLTARLSHRITKKTLITFF